MRTGRPELLAPAGSYEAILAAASAGADAVYVGGTMFGARAYAKNLTQEELMQAMDYLHLRGKKMYLTVNTLLKNKELQGLYDYLAPLYAHGLDAVIVQDLGVMDYISRQFPDLPIHASTQMTITGLPGIKYLESNNVKRTVLARELSLKEISHICHNTHMEIECFIHGALCYCYSGQCLMSSILGGRSGNRGRCAQPCRLTYDAFNGNDKLNNKKDTYLLSPRDICTIDLLPELLNAGVTSLKIEGRMKRAEYTAGVVSIYRKYLDLWMERGASGYKVSAEDRKLLEMLYTRSGFSEGYLKQHNGTNMMTLKKPDYITADESFYESFRKKYIEVKNQESINGNLKILKGKPLTIELEYSGEDGIIPVICEGEPVQCAQKQPLSYEKVFAQMQKTGNTPFKFVDLQIELDDDVFVPIQELNSIRRNALEELEKTVLTSYIRELPDAIPISKSKTIVNDNKLSLSVSVENKAQLKEVLSIEEVKDVYVSYRIFSAKPSVNEFKAIVVESNNKELYFLVPAIFRQVDNLRWAEVIRNFDETGFKGIVVRNMDELGYLKELGYSGAIRSDYSLYTMNDLAVYHVHDLIERDTIPFELNAKEMLRRDCSGSELIVYGYIPLMVSAQCVAGNLGRCKKDNGTIVLKDRYQKEFTIQKDCVACTNTVYNSTPMSLDGYSEKIKSIDPASIRLSFTLEDAKETRRVMRVFINEFFKGQKSPDAFREFTRGHFNRGVE